MGWSSMSDDETIEVEVLVTGTVEVIPANLPLMETPETAAREAMQNKIRSTLGSAVAGVDKVWLSDVHVQGLAETSAADDGEEEGVS